MGPVTYALCGKPAIGVAMWITGLCAFPPLFHDRPISLDAAGTQVSAAFEAPVDKKYLLAAGFEFASREARVHDRLAGGDTGLPCSDGSGRPMPFHVVVRKAGDRSVEIDKTFVASCGLSHDGDRKKTVLIGWLDLPAGQHTAEITNLQAHGGFDGVIVRISLYAGTGK